MGNTIPISAHSNHRYIAPSDAKCTLYIPSARGNIPQTPKVRVREIVLSKNNIEKALIYQDRQNRFQTFGASKLANLPENFPNQGLITPTPSYPRNEAIKNTIPSSQPSQTNTYSSKKSHDPFINKENLEHLAPTSSYRVSPAPINTGKEGLPPSSSSNRPSITNTPDWRKNLKSSEPNSLTSLSKTESNHSQSEPILNPLLKTSTPSKQAITTTPIPIPNVPSFIKNMTDYSSRYSNSTLRENHLYTNASPYSNDPYAYQNYNTPSKTEGGEKQSISTERSRSKEIPARKHRLLLSSSTKKLKTNDVIVPQDSTLFNQPIHKEASTTALLLANGYNNPFLEPNNKSSDISQTIKKELSNLRNNPIMISTIVNPTPNAINSLLPTGLNSGNVTSSSMQSKPSPHDSRIPRLPGLSISRKPDDSKFTDYLHSGDKSKQIQQTFIDIPVPVQGMNDSRGSVISAINGNNSSRPYTLDNSLQIDPHLLRDTSSSPINFIVNSILHKDRGNSPGGYVQNPIVQAIKTELASSHRSRHHDTFGIESDLQRSSKLQTFREGNNFLDSAKIPTIQEDWSQSKISPLLETNLKNFSGRLDFTESPKAQLNLKDYLSPREITFPDPPKISPTSRYDQVVVSPLLSKSPLRDDKATPTKAAQSPSPKPTTSVVSPKKTVSPTSSPQKYGRNSTTPITNPNLQGSYSKKLPSPMKEKSASPQNKVSPKSQKSPQNQKSPSSVSKNSPKEKFPVFKVSSPDEKSPQRSVGSPKENFPIFKVTSPVNRLPTSPDQKSPQYKNTERKSINTPSPNKSESKTERKLSVNSNKNISPKASNASPKVINYSPKGTNISPKAKNQSPKISNISPKASNQASEVKSPTEKYSLRDKYTSSRTKSPASEKSASKIDRSTTSIPERSNKSPAPRPNSTEKSLQEKSISLNRSKTSVEKSIREAPPIIEDQTQLIEDYILLDASPIIEQFPANPKFVDPFPSDPKIIDAPFLTEKTFERSETTSKRSSPKSEHNSIKISSPSRAASSPNRKETSPRDSQSPSPLQSSPVQEIKLSPPKPKPLTPKKDMEPSLPVISSGNSSSNEDRSSSPFIKYLKDSARDLSQNRRSSKKVPPKLPVKVIDFNIEQARKTPEHDPLASISSSSFDRRNDPFSGIINTSMEKKEDPFSGIVNKSTEKKQEPSNNVTNNSANKTNPQTVTAYELALAKVFPTKSPRVEKKYPPLSSKVTNKSLQDQKSSFSNDRSPDVTLSEARTIQQDFNQNATQSHKALQQSSEHPTADSMLFTQLQNLSLTQQDPQIYAQLQNLAQVKEDMLLNLTEMKLQKIQDVFIQKIDSIHKDLLNRIETIQQVSNSNNSTNTHSQSTNNQTIKSPITSQAIDSERAQSKSPAKSKNSDRQALSKSPARRSSDLSKASSKIPESQTESESSYKPSIDVKSVSPLRIEDRSKSKISAKVKKLIKGATNSGKSQLKLSNLIADEPSGDKKHSLHRFSFGGVHDSTNKRLSTSPVKVSNNSNYDTQKAKSKSPSSSPKKRHDDTLPPNASALAAYQKLLGESPIKKNSPVKKPAKRQSSPGSYASSDIASPYRRASDLSEQEQLKTEHIYAKFKFPGMKHYNKSPGYETSPGKGKGTTPGKNSRSASKRSNDKSASPDQIISRKNSKTPTKKVVSIKKQDSRTISPSDIKNSPLQSSSKKTYNNNLEGSQFTTHVELFPSTDRHARNYKDRIYPQVPQLRGLASLNPLENHVIIDENGFHTPPPQNFPTLEKELEEAFEAAAKTKEYNSTNKNETIIPKLQTKTGPTLQTSSNLLTLSPEKTSERKVPTNHPEKTHFIPQEALTKFVKPTSADTESSLKSASFKVKEKSVINYEKEEENYLRRVLNQKPINQTNSPAIQSQSKALEMKGTAGSSFAYPLKPKYQDDLSENVPPKEVLESGKIKKVGSRQNSVSKNDPSSLFMVEKKEIVDIPTGQSAEYSSNNIDQSSSLHTGETAVDRERRLRDEIKYLKTKLKDLTAKGLTVSPNKLLKNKTKKLKTKTKLSAKTFDDQKGERKSEEKVHKRQRSSSKSAAKSRETTPTPTPLAKKMSASLVEPTSDIECRKLSNTPIRFEMRNNSTVSLVKRKSSIEDINRKLAKSSTTTKLKQNAIKQAQERFFEEYSNKINDDDLRKVSKNLEIEDLMRAGRGMIRSSSVKAKH